ncbi:MAG: hypothetical protein AB7E76_02665 [Deferribacterales bacterium]
MDKFAKLYETEKYGQILVLKEDHEDEPSISVKVRPEGLGGASFSFNYNDSDEGIEELCRCFDEFTQEAAEEAAEFIFNSVKDTLLKSTES